MFSHACEYRVIINASQFYLVSFPFYQDLLRFVREHHQPLYRSFHFIGQISTALCMMSIMTCQSISGQRLSSQTVVVHTKIIPLNTHELHELPHFQTINSVYFNPHGKELLSRKIYLLNNIGLILGKVYKLIQQLVLLTFLMNNFYSGFLVANMDDNDFISYIMFITFCTAACLIKTNDTIRYDIIRYDTIRYNYQGILNPINQEDSPYLIYLA